MATPKGYGWESRLLGWLEWPASIALANLTWFVLSLPVVTWLAAAVAMTEALDRWRRHGEPRVVRGTLLAWRRHWRRALPVSLVSTAVLAVLVVNGLFLATRTGPAAIVLLCGVGGLLYAWIALHLALVPLMALFPDLPTSAWLREAFVLAFQHPLVTTANVAVTVLVTVAMTWLPTLVPFASAAIVALLALQACHAHLAATPDVDPGT